MPVILALAGAFIIAAVVELGTKAGADAAFMFRLIALGVLALCAFTGIWLHHRRKSQQMELTRYHDHGNRHKWQRASFIGAKEVRICPDCHVPVHNYAAQEGHDGHHQYLWALADRVQELERLIAEARGGVPVEPVKEPPWTAVVEPAEAPQTVTEHEQAPQIEEEEPRFARFREAMERINATHAN